MTFTAFVLSQTSQYPTIVSYETNSMTFFVTRKKSLYSTWKQPRKCQIPENKLTANTSHRMTCHSAVQRYIPYSLNEIFISSDISIFYVSVFTNNYLTVVRVIMNQLL